MIALIYVVLFVAVGDTVSRRVFGFVSRPHRLATAFLVGLVLSTWLTYLLALLFSVADQPLVLANLIAIPLMAGIVVVGAQPAWLRSRWPAWAPTSVPGLAGRPFEGAPGTRRSDRWDWVITAAIALLAAWMMVSTLQFADNRILIGLHEYGDFGPSTAIAQGFALGHNFPTEYPLFAGAPILYHFLFLFQVGNLTFLGLDPAVANNLLSIGSLVALVVLVMAIGERLFRSTAIGRLGAGLFFAHGSLSFIPFLARFPSPAEMLAGIRGLENYLSSGFAYRSEDWAIWTQNVFLNQRHLASGIGIFLVALYFVVDRLVAAETVTDPIGDAGASRPDLRRAGAVLRDRASQPWSHIRAGLADPALPGYILAGLLLGLLPLWNGSMYAAAAAVLAVVFVVFRNRVQMLVLAVAAAVPAIPQIVYLRPEGMPSTDYPDVRWGYVVEDANPLNVAIYLGFIFGPKIVLMAIALTGATSIQRRLFVAISSLVVVAFTLQLTFDVAQNHKFLNAWLIVGNLFAAAGLVRLWNARSSLRVPGRLVAVGLALVVAVGGLIDLVPIKNDPLLAVPLRGDRLYDWVEQETERSAVFLTDLHIVHPIMLAGRRIYYGWPAYPLSLGYDLATREREYRDLYGMRSPRELVRRLQADGIGYVAFDDGLRERGFVDQLNEDVYATHLEPVFRDTENRYGHLTIYRVPTDPGAWEALPGAPPVDMFTGGRGTDAGRFDAPRGLGLGPAGEILVADTQNHRIERFDAEGTYLAEFGSRGDGPGQFNEPNGVAVNSRGHVFVTDTLHHKVQEFDPAGAFVAEWTGAEPGFYGPRDLEVGPDDTLYVLDQGRARVVKRTASGEVSSFGTLGAGDGQLNDPTGFALAGERLYVADPANRRIVVFEAASGSFVRTIPMADWGAPLTYPDVAVEPDESAIYASVPSSGEIVVLDAEGTPTGTLEAVGGEAPKTPTALVRTGPGELLVLDFGSNRVVRVGANSP